MNTTELTQLIETLDEGVLNILLDGKALLLVDDITLVNGDTNAPNVFVAPGQFSANDARQLRQELVDKAGQLLEDYYRVHPLTRHGFDAQASPRHRYGVYCELPKSMDADAASSTLEKWLANGEAYEQYLGANVCRYNC